MWAYMQYREPFSIVKWEIFKRVENSRNVSGSLLVKGNSWTRSLLHLHVFMNLYSLCKECTCLLKWIYMCVIDVLFTFCNICNWELGIAALSASCVLWYIFYKRERNTILPQRGWKILSTLNLFMAGVRNQMTAFVSLFYILVQ